MTELGYDTRLLGLALIRLGNKPRTSLART
jgi:hypothetical protein